MFKCNNVITASLPIIIVCQMLRDRQWPTNDSVGVLRLIREPNQFNEDPPNELRHWADIEICEYSIPRNLF